MEQKLVGLSEDRSSWNQTQLFSFLILILKVGVTEQLIFVIVQSLC